MPHQRGSVVQCESALRFLPLPLWGPPLLALPLLPFPFAPLVSLDDIEYSLLPESPQFTREFPKKCSYAGLNSARRIISSLISRASRSVAAAGASPEFAPSCINRSSCSSNNS